jgi:hypothetical protein
MDEDAISRTTLYLPKYLHTAAKEAGLNFSQEVKRYLETVLFGEETSDLQYQLNKIRDRKKQLQIELTSLVAREEELSKLLSEHDVKMKSEKELYEKFLGYMNNRIKNAEKVGISIDFNQAARFLRQDYFPKNGLGSDCVAEIIRLVKKDDFDFEDFRTLRKGGSLDN